METNLIKLHRDAERIAPHARLEECDVTFAKLNLGPTHIVCDVPAWGGYFARSVENPARVICLDPTPAIVNCPGATVIGSNATRHALRDASVDRLVSLAGLHHHPRPQVFITESLRVLRPQGIAVLSEVDGDSPVATFLNTDVHRYRERGHKGVFLRSGDLTTMMMVAGFTSVHEETVPLKWRFNNTGQLITYVQHLFAMVKASEAQVWAAIQSRFTVTTEDGKVCLPWPLLYGVGVKS